MSNGGIDKLLGKPVPHFYVLGDHSLKGSPNQWALAVKSAYSKHGASKVIAEVNQGGDLVELNIRNIDPIGLKKVHASKGKQARAEPISILYEMGRVHHVGYYNDLEEQCCEWDPKRSESPDRVDALVWALTELMGGSLIGKLDLSGFITTVQRGSRFGFDRAHPLYRQGYRGIW